MNAAREVLGCLLLLALTCATGAAQDAKQQPKRAGDAFKNIQLLNDLPEEQFWATMSFFADSLGVNCEHCHPDPYDADTRPAKVKARQMPSHGP